jgi:hypothetical protein
MSHAGHASCDPRDVLETRLSISASFPLYILSPYPLEVDVMCVYGCAWRSWPY